MLHEQLRVSTGEHLEIAQFYDLLLTVLLDCCFNEVEEWVLRSLVVVYDSQCAVGCGHVLITINDLESIAGLNGAKYRRSRSAPDLRKGHLCE